MATLAELAGYHPNYVRTLLQNRVNGHNRKARLEGIVGTFTVEEWLKKLDEYQGRCSHCGETEFLTIDHRIPTSKGGNNTIENIVPLCQRCNCSKNDKGAPLLLSDVHLAFAVDDATLNALDEYARQTRTPKSQVIRDALKAFLEAKKI